MTKEATRALERIERFITKCNYFDDFVNDFTAVKKALAQPEQAPCDMGVMCAGCTPRNPDGSCPAAQPTVAEPHKQEPLENRFVRELREYAKLNADLPLFPLWNVRRALKYLDGYTTPPAAQPEQKPVALRYDGLYEYAQANRLSYNELCAVVTAAVTPAAKSEQEPVAWPCLIAEADFSQNTVTLAMQCEDYKVSAGQHWLYTTLPAQSEQEPVGMFWFNPQDKLWYQTLSYHDDDDRYQPLYATPPAAQRKPLTDKQIESVWRNVQANDFHDCVQPFARAIEAAHGIEENT